MQLTNTWTLHSIGALGYSASHANLSYDGSSELNIQYYLQSNQLMTLWMPMVLHAEPGMWGAALKSSMNDQINDILRWSNASVVSRRAGDKAEPFPPRTLPGSAIDQADSRK